MICVGGKNIAVELSLALVLWPCDESTVPLKSALHHSRASTSLRDCKSSQETKCAMFFMVHVHERKLWMQIEHAFGKLSHTFLLSIGINLLTTFIILIIWKLHIRPPRLIPSYFLIFLNLS